MTRTAGLHALADALNTVKIGQFIVGQEGQGNGCVEAAGYAAAFARLVFEGDLYSVNSHWCGGAASAEVCIELTHSLLYQLVPISIHLQGQIT